MKRKIRKIKRKVIRNLQRTLDNKLLALLVLMFGISVDKFMGVSCGAGLWMGIIGALPLFLAKESIFERDGGF